MSSRLFCILFHTVHWNVDKHHQAPKTDGQTDSFHFRLHWIPIHGTIYYSFSYSYRWWVRCLQWAWLYTEDHQDRIVSVLKIAVCHCSVLQILCRAATSGLKVNSKMLEQSFNSKLILEFWSSITLFKSISLSKETCPDIKKMLWCSQVDSEDQDPPVNLKLVSQESHLL